MGDYIVDVCADILKINSSVKCLYDELKELDANCAYEVKALVKMVGDSEIQTVLYDLTNICVRLKQIKSRLELLQSILQRLNTQRDQAPHIPQPKPQ